MTNNTLISHIETPSSYTTLSALLLGTVLSVANYAPAIHGYALNQYLPYKVYKQDSSYDSFTNPISGELKMVTDDFEQEITFFFSKLSASQQTLGKKFEDALFKNLWNLYEN
jgi:hypothetical protein